MPKHMWSYRASLSGGLEPVSTQEGASGTLPSGTSGYHVGVEMDPQSQAYRHILEHLNQQEGWNLDAAAQEHYVREISARNPHERLGKRSEQIVRNYHQDHWQLQALTDPHRSDHPDAWAQVQNHILVAARRHNLTSLRDTAMGTDDIVQIVQAEIVRSLPSYRYESSFRTWVFSVTTRRLQRLLRDGGAEKRAIQPDSIDTIEDELIDPEGIEPVANARALLQQIEQILIRAEGPRLARIFRLHGHDDRTVEEIGRFVHLHPSRVRVLLARAREILQADPTITTWKHQEDVDT
jgi:RNA polymerase sigma factor (sigma-70 family)